MIGYEYCSNKIKFIRYYRINYSETEFCLTHLIIQINKGNVRQRSLVYTSGGY